MKARPRSPSRTASAVAAVLVGEGMELSRASDVARRVVLAVAAARATRDVGVGGDALGREGVAILRALEAGRIGVGVIAEASTVFARASGSVDVASVVVSATDLRDVEADLASLMRAYVEGDPLASDPIDAWQLAYEDLLAFAVARGADGQTTLVPSSGRRAMGAHFTPRAVTDRLVERALARSSTTGARAAVLDPAMGAGAFLVGAARRLADGVPSALRRIVAERIAGVDRDVVTCVVARVSLWLLAQGETAAGSEHLRHADALVGSDETTGVAAAESGLRARHPALFAPGGTPPLHRAQLLDVAPNGFDLVVGNPPWISYAGRAAQPLAPDVRAWYTTFGEAFGGYRSIQALFVERFLRWLAPGGRLAFVLPTSMSDLDGYAPFRRAHDRLAQVDVELDDFGDGGFEGVFQPCMGLTSTRVEGGRTGTIGAAFPLARRDAEPEVDALVRHLSSLPRVPVSLFGERGFQTTARERALLTASPSSAPDAIALRNGADLGAFRRGEPSAHASRAALGPRLRGVEAWKDVRVLVRQTARFPIACLSDGLAFRNSILAGFDDPAHPAPLLVAYLNSSPIRLFHHARVRDARQGMPQVKIAHLRALPAFPSDERLRKELERRGALLSQRNDGIDAAEQDAIDALVSDALELDASMRGAVAVFRDHMRGRGEPGYKPRG